MGDDGDHLVHGSRGPSVRVQRRSASSDIAFGFLWSTLDSITLVFMGRRCRNRHTNRFVDSSLLEHISSMVSIISVDVLSPVTDMLYNFSDRAWSDI
jgi:hypothetical protein